MKVPTGNLLAANPKNTAIVQDAIIEAGEFLGVPIKEIEVKYPPPINDFDMFKYKIAWYGIMTGIPEGWQGQPKIGARMQWPEVPTPEDISLSMKRSTAFAILVGMLPERRFIYNAIEAFRFDHDVLMLGVYKNEALNLIDRIMNEQMKVHMSENKRNGSETRWKPVLPSIAKIQEMIVDSLKTGSIEFLKDIHGRMEADLRQAKQ